MAARLNPMAQRIDPGGSTSRKGPIAHHDAVPIARCLERARPLAAGQAGARKPVPVRRAMGLAARDLHRRLGAVPSGRPRPLRHRGGGHSADPARDRRHKTQELEGFRFGTSAPLAVLRRKATELYQAGLFRMKRQRELPQPVAHRVPEAASVVLMLEAHDCVIGVPDHDHVTRGLAPSPAFGQRSKT